MTAISPWWYRQRALCIALLYFASFFGAYYLTVAAHRPRVPFYAFFGARWEAPILFGTVVLATIGWLLRAWGTSYLRVEVVWNGNALSDRLYVAGPFRFTRNPLYLGNLCQAVAFATFVPPAGLWLVPFVQWLFINGLIGVEERGMRARYGQAFDAYCAAVPRLLPRLIPAPGEPAPHVPLGRGLLWETLSFAFVVALLVFAIFGRAAWQATWLIAALGAVLQYAVRAQARAGAFRSRSSRV